MRTHGWSGAAPGSDEEAVARILEAAGKAIDQKVMQETARLLTSNDPALIQRAVKNAANSNKSADVLKAIEHGILEREERVQAETRRAETGRAETR